MLQRFTVQKIKGIGGTYYQVANAQTGKPLKCSTHTKEEAAHDAAEAANAAYNACLLEYKENLELQLKNLNLLIGG